MTGELGIFLRARRSNSQLDSAEHRTSGRRRVTGLRREEVSAASGISLDYYTRIEQGRETHPSDSVLDALSRALRLEPDAVDHLYKLRDAAAVSRRTKAAIDASVNKRMEALVEAVSPNPAYVMDRQQYSRRERGRAGALRRASGSSASAPKHVPVSADRPSSGPGLPRTGRAGAGRCRPSSGGKREQT